MFSLNHFKVIPNDADTSEDYSICHFPEHRDFVRICREAEKEAHRTGQKTQYWWRGARGVVAGNLPPITSQGLEYRLMSALQKVSDKTVAETMVKKIKKKVLLYIILILFLLVRPSLVP